MKNIYLMTAIATTEVSSPAGPRLRQRLYAVAARLSRRLRRIVNNRIAAMIAYREHQATLSALGKLSDPELKDFGVYRGSPGSAFHRHRDVKFPSTRRGWPR